MHVVLRPWSMDDLDELVALANNKHIAQYMADVFPHPYSKENGIAFINMASSNPNSCIFSITLNNKPIGSIGLHLQADNLKKNAEIGYWLGEQYWGRGLMNEAIKQMVDYGFKNLDIVRIFARIFGNNKASQKVIEKAHFKLEGKFVKTIYKNNEFLDELIYAIRKP